MICLKDFRHCRSSRFRSRSFTAGHRGDKSSDHAHIGHHFLSSSITQPFSFSSSHMATTDAAVKQSHHCSCYVQSDNHFSVRDFELHLYIFIIEPKVSSVLCFLGFFLFVLFCWWIVLVLLTHSFCFCAMLLWMYNLICFALFGHWHCSNCCRVE